MSESSRKYRPSDRISRGKTNSNTSDLYESLMKKKSS